MKQQEEIEFLKRENEELKQKLAALPEKIHKDKELKLNAISSAAQSSRK